ncbi:MAG: hypothetical protein ACLQDL_10370 [Spirochaetia bacterium]
MRSASDSLGRILDLLESIPGVHRVGRLSDEQRRRAIALEARHERSSVIPVRNLGVRLLADRHVCCALLKDSTFRAPRVPTVYLVEEDAPDECAHVLDVAGRRYAVVGEEVLEGRAPSAETTIPLEKSFVIFPERRRGADIPCLFLLPPIAFPELEKDAAALGISDIVSVSPSLATDALLRDAFGFPPTNDLATLLVGFNIDQG